MTREVSTIFRVLKECTSKSDAKIENCMAKAITQIKKGDKESLSTFITYRFLDVGYTCIAIESIFSANKDLLDDEQKFPRTLKKTKELFRDLKICQLINGDPELATKLKRIMLQQ